MKTYVLYHGNCSDGFGAALAAWRFFGAGAEYVPVSYGKPLPAMEDYSAVTILDFSYPRAVLEGLAERMCSLMVLDHHLTAEAELRGLDYCTFDLAKSGAVLAWEYFFPGEPVPQFMRYIQDRDLWRWELPGSREFSAALGSYEREFMVWLALSGIQPNGRLISEELVLIDKLIEEGEACLRVTRQAVEAMARNHRWAWFNTETAVVQVFGAAGNNILEHPTHPSHANKGHYYVPVANATVFFSEVGERLLELYPNAQFAGYYLDRADGKRQWGLRSRPEFDCSAVARVFGGGGHRCAAGFTEKG